MDSLARQRKIFIVSFLFIPILLLLLFVVYPAADLLKMSFTDWDGISDVQNYVGLANYKKMIFNSKDVWMALRNNGIYFYVHALFIPLELAIAMVLDSKIRGSKFFKTIVFMPYIINGAAVSYAFSYFFSSSNGGLDGILKILGMEHFIQNWLSNESIVNYSLTSVSLWRFCGLHIILFLAGLQSIPKDIIEASIIDGANSVQKYFNIIIPGIKRVVEIILFLNVRGALQVFDIPFLITQGGPGTASSTFTLYTIDTAFKFNNFGMASTMGVTLLVLIVILSWVQKKLFNLRGW